MVTIVNVLLFIFAVLEAVAVILVGILAWLEINPISWYGDRKIKIAKAKLRKEKEEVARESFFDEPYVRGFDSYGSLYHRSHHVPTSMAMEYYQTMENLADTQVMRVMDLEEL